MMLGDLAQGELDGTGNAHPRAFRRRSHPPRLPAKTKSTGEFVGEQVHLSSEPLAPAQIMKVLRLGQFLPQLAQPLLVGRSRLGIKDFPGVPEPLDVIAWQAGVLKEMNVSGFLVHLRTRGYQSED